MSEKRFTLRDGLTFEFSNIQDNGNDLSFEDIVDLLNEQQATIRRLQDLCGESDGENATLQQRIRDIKYNNCGEK